MDWLTSVPIAHRGLHDSSQGIIENSASAFAAAIEAGYGIECDIQISSDGEAMVFHDRKLDRLTSESGPLAKRPSKEIGNISLKGTGDHIQTLGELLEQIDGKVPLLVEIKALAGPPGPLEQRVATLLAKCSGPVAIMSFNPGTVTWFRSQAPSIIRGQLSTAFKDGPASKRPWHQRFAARHLLVNAVSRPHFVGYDIKYLPSLAPGMVRLLGMPVLTWTVKTKHHRHIASRSADNIIFEGFRPPLDWASAK